MPISRLKMGTREEITRPELLKSAIAEFFSTILFVFASRGSSISFQKLTGCVSQTPTGLLISAFSNSFALSAAIAASANTSGGHLNPAITFAIFLGGHITLIRAILYIASQLIASITAAFLLKLVIGADPSAAMPSSPTSNAVLLEGLKTFGLVMTVCAVAAKGKLGGGGAVLAPLVIGFSVGANVMVGGSFEGAVMNPAAMFGPAVVGWAWDGKWLCWAGQFLGGGLAGILYEFFFGTIELL
ncbi:aquaporin TIP1-1-like [Phalaenopsis equestris]|uniref:aquaporin TIP1-1-like n=1 Tax=Phalaenopsis equestris TaxID=78828 RepID=UPI0009E421BA|nr:aquaporin TIP1-1-like [Phalaenopsis equestris]